MSKILELEDECYGALEVCAGCLGHAWLVRRVIDDRGDRPEIYSCPMCNSDGERPIGIIDDRRQYE